MTHKQQIMELLQTYPNTIKNAFNISSADTCRTFWSFTLLNLLILSLLLYLGKKIPIFSVLFPLYIIFLSIPLTAAIVRRFNDAGKDIWLLFTFYLFFLVGILLSHTINGYFNTLSIAAICSLIYILLSKSQKRENPMSTLATINARFAFYAMIFPLPLLLLVTLTLGCINSFFQIHHDYYLKKSLDQIEIIEQTIPCLYKDKPIYANLNNQTVKRNRLVPQDMQKCSEKNCLRHALNGEIIIESSPWVEHKKFHIILNDLSSFSCKKLYKLLNKKKTYAVIGASENKLTTETIIKNPRPLTHPSCRCEQKTCAVAILFTDKY